MLALVPMAVVASYLGWLGLRGRRRAEAAWASGVPPAVDVLVPVHDEAALVLDKLRNLEALEYPEGSLRFLLVDGGSHDGTAEAVAAFCAHDRRFELLLTGDRNKVAQLNAGLRRARSDWVLVTDADARLEPGTLLALVRAALADPGLGVVGPPVAPAEAHPVERLHWTVANWMRRREHGCGSASIVAGPCYLFRRELVEAFPPDVIADDVHVACRAAVSGLRTGLAGPLVRELRAPRTLGALLRHKVRKADAYLREVFRFLPDARRMPQPMRAVFLWRAALLTLAPSCAVGAAALLCLGADPSLAATGATLTLLAAGRGPGLVARCTASVLLPPLLAVAATLALLGHPFSRQTAHYRKVAAPGRRRQAAG